MKKYPLRGLFIGGIVVSYVIVTAGVFFSFDRGSREIRDRYASRFAAAQNALGKIRILSIIDRELALSLKLADDPSIRGWMLDEGDRSKEGAAFSQLESYQRFLRDGAYFVALASSGRYYARTPGLSAIRTTVLRQEEPGDRWFFQALRENKDYSLNVDHNAMLGENRVWINVLVRDGDGKPIGVAGCGLDLTEFLDALVANPEPGISLVLIDSSGALMAYRDRNLVVYNAESTAEADKKSVYDLIPFRADRWLLRERIQNLVEGKTPGSPVFLRFESRRALCAADALPELGWFSLAFLEVESVFDPRDFLPLTAAAIVALLLIAAVVLFLVERLVLRPLSALNRAAGTVAAGTYDVALPEGAASEIDELSASFGAMTVQIREYTIGLERMVEERTRELTEANRSITDSLRYARLIQDAILPDPKELSGAVSGSFIIHRPRDLVGGDFVFFRPLEDGFWVAVVDCTGHGVPGALMAMMVNAALQRVAEAAGDDSPAELLSHAHRAVRETLRGGDEHLQNGFDIGLFRYRAAADALEYAGGGLSAYVVRDGAVEELRGDRSSLGYSSVPADRTWGGHRLERARGMTVYLASDGVLDLPGGSRGFGFGRVRLMALLESIRNIPLEDQEARVASELDAYRGNVPQKDDLTFLGFRI